MPFTPFHEGPAILIGLLLISVLDFPTLLITSVIIDIEPLMVIIFDLDYPLHGYLHTFLGATFMAIITSLVMIPLRPYLTPLLEAFKIVQEIDSKKILISSFLGTYSHILLDAPLYREMNPFFPYLDNPLFNTLSVSVIYSFCSVALILGLAVYVIHFIRSSVAFSKKTK